MNKLLTVGFEKEEQALFAKALAEQLHLVLDNHHLPRLHLTPQRLELLIKGFSPMAVDFHQSGQRRLKAGKKQGLIRACRPASGLRILDATAGWGKDAAILASFGAEVLMLERSPIMGVLLEDGLKRLRSDSSLANRLTLQKINAVDYLKVLKESERPDVIYLDPMHPIRKKSALVKKEMQALQYLLGTDEDAQELLETALQKTLQRVVVKWPQYAPPLGLPSTTIEGKTVRFDVYSHR